MREIGEEQGKDRAVVAALLSQRRDHRGLVALARPC
jgi:hypothetical protein